MSAKYFLYSEPNAHIGPDTLSNLPERRRSRMCGQYQHGHPRSDRSGELSTSTGRPRRSSASPTRAAAEMIAFSLVIYSRYSAGAPTPSRSRLVWATPGATC